MSTAYHALFVESLASRLRAWQAEGKLDLDDLDRSLSPRARAWVEGSCEAAATPAEDVETLVALAAEQFGGEAALAELAGGIAPAWQERVPFADLLRAARSLVDGPGFVVSQAAELLVVAPDWSFSGSREHFSVRLEGVASASPALKSYLGALLARLASAAAGASCEVHVEGLDQGALCVSGRRDPDRIDRSGDAVRLARAALA